MEKSEVIKQMVLQSPENHAFKIAFLQELLNENKDKEFEKYLFQFLSKVSSEDPMFPMLKSFLGKRKNALKEEITSEKKDILPFEEEEDFYFGDDEDYEMDDDKPLKIEKVSFDDVGGMEEAKKRVKQLIINPFKNESLFRVYNKKIGGGILFYGPPGCGKTYLAKAISHEVESTFYEVALHEILDMWVGSSENAIHETFEKARRNTPCVLFFDEVDALSFQRSKIQQNTDNRIINQFLKEFQGVATDNDKILIIGATNLPWNIDPAFRRPGRFDKVIFCPPPDLGARKKIFEIYLKEKPAESGIDLDLLAKKTKDFSGADIKHVIDEVGHDCFEEALEKDAVVEISQKRLLNMIKKTNPSTKEWFNTAQKYLDYANTDGLYDDIKDYIRNRN